MARGGKREREREKVGGSGVACVQGLEWVVVGGWVEGRERR